MHLSLSPHCLHKICLSRSRDVHGHHRRKSGPEPKVQRRGELYQRRKLQDPLPNVEQAVYDLGAVRRVGALPPVDGSAEDRRGASRPLRRGPSELGAEAGSVALSDHAVPARA